LPREIHREELRRLLESGPQLVEVLPKDEYEQDHLPGAINLPLRHVEDRAMDLLQPDRAVVVYCWDDA
jgi:rhodanese-related sulfurtransferase